MEVEIRHCNNIRQWTLYIEEWKINIFYWINGTWKSTISKAIYLKVNWLHLNILKPFSWNNDPEVILPDTVRNILIFNEDYINDFVYKNDELLSNSFDIFIKTDQYKENERRINELLWWIRDLFNNNETLNRIIEDFFTLKSAFKWNSDWNLSRQSEFHKAYWGWNLIQNIPEWLAWYRPFLQSGNCTQWIDWQTKGNVFWEHSNICPYCTSSITEKKNEIRRVSETYNKNDIEKLVKIKNIVNHLWDYFSDQVRQSIIEITNQPNWITLEQNTFLKGIYDQIETLYIKLQNLRNISFEAFSECDDINQKLNEFKINLTLIGGFNSQHTEGIINWFNEKIDQLNQEIWRLRWLINIQNRELTNLVQKYKIGINSFLKKAGYNYEIDMPRDQNYKLRLKPSWMEEYLNWWKQHLSFWEKNAFALILFMYEVISKKPDLVVLDDPISSFDDNKKYAIMHTLFTWNTESSLKWRNVIMLTHDIEPIIDMKKVKTGIFNNDSVFASFIKNNAWSLEVEEILKEDILSFYQIRERIKDSEEDDIVKLVYLRKLYNWLNNSWDEYQILSNLLHWRTRGDCLDYRLSPWTLLSNESFERWNRNIMENREDFDYERLSEILSNTDKMVQKYRATSSNLTKIILFRRIYKNTNHENNNQNNEIDEIVDKFIKEEYHIENSYLFSLDPAKFDTIPEFIIGKCDEFINNLES